MVVVVVVVVLNIYQGFSVRSTLRKPQYLHEVASITHSLINNASMKEPHTVKNQSASVHERSLPVTVKNISKLCEGSISMYLAVCGALDFICARWVS